ncbi:putative ATP binding [Lyophyllum shimeji]|uniref:ATP binding n=1 Tax=Lyophyllum shimeji TaxID=47721 RepID=A0A9P3ULQ2_LYOSH|nr:putative ATP binding [Lyophyllum shimeji]
MPPRRLPYSGTSRKLVLAFDIGTTFSGISYSILDPAQVPEIKGVTRFPAQERVGGASKIPTIVYYDQEGRVRAVGAEATRDSIRDTIEDEGWVKAEWFKLHMRPRAIYGENASNEIPPLPPGKTVVDIFADFMRYLYTCAKTFIQESHPNGVTLWSTLERNIDYVLSHPNGWHGAQQQQMRRAAVLASLIPDTMEGQSRIRLVTEGEASLHFCIQQGLTAEALQTGGGVLIVDAGGGTVDLSAYGQAPNGAFEEITVGECHLQGSVYVTNRAQRFLKGFLAGSRFYDDIEAMKTYFDQSAKLTFANVNDPLFITFGGARDRDQRLRIRGGQIRLNGDEVATFFDPSVACIVQAVLSQCSASRKPISSVFLVGGFSASEYLFSQLRAALEPRNLSICRPDTHLNKAVADGAVSFYLDHSVTTRVSKFPYGVPCSVKYDPGNAEHASRASLVRLNTVEGIRYLDNMFSTLLYKNVQTSEIQEFRRSYYETANSPAELSHVSTSILCYRGSLDRPQWRDVDSDKFAISCYIRADTSSLVPTRITRFNAGSLLPHVYYRIDFDIVLIFGLTELKAQIAWIENEKEKRGLATIVHVEDGE